MEEKTKIQRIRPRMETAIINKPVQKIASTNTIQESSIKTQLKLIQTRILKHHLKNKNKNQAAN